MENEILEHYFSGSYSLKESSIPLSLVEQSLIALGEGKLLGKRYLFVIERQELSFSRISALNLRFASVSSWPLVFLLRGNPRSVAKELMGSQIAFITSDGFIFIPQVVICGQLPSPFRQQALVWHDSYIPVAQYFLLNPSAKVNSLSLQSELSFYSRPLLIKALAYLTQLGFLKQEGAVRSTAYSLAGSLPDSYVLIKERFINPVRGSYFVKENEASSLPHEILSSESALSFYTNVSPEEEAYLLSKKEYEEHRNLFVSAKQRAFQEVYLRYDVFVYHPLLARKGSSFVLNPLDVIAIYRADKDPRVEDAIDHLEEAYR
jgi:hypothetical protein